ncbi:hypothetical protein [Bacillus sp. REN10]|nr:hypothetical protein [Bacillus sp. REN10]
MKKDKVLKYSLVVGVLALISIFVLPDFIQGFIEGFNDGLYGR